MPDLELQSTSAQPENQIQESELVSENPAQTIEELKRLLKQRDLEIRSLKLQLDESREYLDEIKQSRAWTLVHWVWSIVRVLFPNGSMQRKALNALARPLLTWMDLGTFSMISRIIKRISQTHISHIFSRALVRLAPRPVKDFFIALKQEQPLYDRSEVILFADDDILPAYLPRYPLQNALDETHTKLKISLIATTYNEASNVREWLHSLLYGSRQPDEIVITDAGSNDGTVEIIEEVALTFPIEIRVIQEPGANIARGRNLAIKHASFPIIACSDLGCVLDKQWLEYLILPFEFDDRIEFCTGYYQAKASDEFSRLSSSYFIAELSQVNPQNFLPSSRSIAMKKSLWQQIGGYPEWLTDAGEDTLFDYHIKLQPVRLAFVPQAIAVWQPPKNLKSLYKTFFRYAKGDGEAGMFASQYREKIISLLWRSFLLGVLVIILTLIGFWVWNTFGPRVLLSAGLILVLLTILWIAIDIQRLSVRWKVTPRSAIAGKLMPKVISLARPFGYLSGILARPYVKQRKIYYFQRQLEEILNNHLNRKGVILYPPTHDWGFMFQLPQQMARGFARKEYLYFYCTSNEITDSVIGFQEVENGLYLTHVPLEVFSIVDNLIVYIGSPWHCYVPELFEYPRVIYDHYDDLQVSSGRLEDHKALLESADVVLVTAKRLLDDIEPYRPDALFLPNGVDYEYIQTLRPSNSDNLPHDWLPIAESGKPVVGYSGSLAERFDYDLFRYLVTTRSDLKFVLIGVSYDGSLERSGILEAGLNNLHWLGMKPYDHLFQYVWRFDVGIIPFKINRITQATTSIKLFEYMACQVPVLSTDMPESARYPGVFIADDAVDFCRQIDRAFDAGQDPDYLDLIDEIARKHSWENRVNAITERLGCT